MNINPLEKKKKIFFFFFFFFQIKIDYYLTAGSPGNLGFVEFVDHFGFNAILYG